MAKSSFLVYFDYYEHLQLLSDAEQGRLFMAMIRYAEDETMPNFSGTLQMAFSFIKSQMDRDNGKYTAICEKRRDSGAKGGRPKKQMVSKKANGFSEKQTKAKKPDTDTDTDNDTDTDTDTEKIKESGAAAPTLPQEKQIARHKYGAYGWVKLSDAEYQRIVDEYGVEKAQYYINIVDEKAQQTGNKNKWRDWNLTVRNAIRNKWGLQNSRAAPKPDIAEMVQKNPDIASYLAVANKALMPEDDNYG